MPTTSSLFLAPLRFSTQIAGSPIISAPGSAPVLRIRCWRRFSASRCEVSLVPVRFPRPLPRRRNALRDKASPLRPPPVVPHQVRHPYGEAPNLESLDSQEPKSGCLDAEPSSDLKEKLEISSVLGASRSGNVALESELDGEKDATGAAEEITLCGTGAGLAFSVYEGPDGNAVRIEVDEDEIINRSEAAVGEGSVGLECVFRARVMAMELEHGKPVAPKSRSLFQFVAADRVESPVLNEEVSVLQRNVPPLRSFACSGLAALCGVCLVFAVSKLIQTNSKEHLMRRLLYMHRPGMEWDEFDKGNISMPKNAHGFPGGFQRRPHVDRKELMNNIKRAKESREWSVLRNSFSCKTVANGDNASITEIRRKVKEIHRSEEGILEQSSTEENSGIVFPHLIFASDEEDSSIYGNQSDVNDVSDSSKLSSFSLLSDKIEETVEQTVDMENREAFISTSVKDADSIGEIELPDPAYKNDQETDANDRASDINALEKEAQIVPVDYHNLDPNRINNTSCELESEEAFAETCAKNLDIIQGTKPSVPFTSYQQTIHAKDNSHEFSTNAVSERADDLSSDCFDQSSSELRSKKTPMDITVNDVNGIQEIEAPRTSAKDAQTAHHKEFTYHNINTIDEEECKTAIVTDTVTATSSHGSREEPIDMKRDSMQLAQEPKPSISCWNDKQPSPVNEKDHRERTVQNEGTEYTGILDNAGTSSLYAPPEESVQQNFSKISVSEKKQEKRTSSSKKARAHLVKNKVKLQKEVCSSREAEAKQSEQGVSGTKDVNGPSNCVQKTKKVAKKRLKKVQSDMQRVATQGDDQSNGMVDQKNNSQNIKKTRRNLKNALSNHEAQTRGVNSETTLEVNSAYNAPADNVEPLHVAAPSMQTQLSKDAFSKEQPNGSSVSKMRKQGLKVTI